MPIGFKNNTSGNIDVAVNGIAAASQSHAFVSVNSSGRLSSIETKGNPDGHLVLRGGASQPNYDAQSIAYALERLRCSQLPDGVIVDCSHDNSQRCHIRQHAVFQSAVNQIVAGNQNIRGAILESHIHEGQQSFRYRHRL